MSLSSKLFLFALSFFILGSIICNVTSGAVLTQAQISGVNSLKSPGAGDINFFTKISDVLSWNYPIFNNPDGTDSDWVYIKYIFLWPLTAAVVIPIFLMLIVAAASVFGNVFRGIFG